MYAIFFVLEILSTFLNPFTLKLSLAIIVWIYDHFDQYLRKKND